MDDRQKAEAALLVLALDADAKGQVQALRFYLCNRHPDRWKSEAARAAEPATPFAKKIIRILDGTEEENDHDDRTISADAVQSDSTGSPAAAVL